MNFDPLYVDVHCHVQEPGKRDPHIRRLIRIDPDEGVLVFDGYYYASESELPAMAHLVISSDARFLYAAVIEILEKQSDKVSSR